MNHLIAAYPMRYRTQRALLPEREYLFAAQQPELTMSHTEAAIGNLGHMKVEYGDRENSVAMLS